MAALSFTTMEALGLDSLASGVARTSFGYRQVGSGLMIALVSFGLVAQSVQAMQGSWAVGGPERLPPAYQVIGSGSPPAYRVLWVGRRVGGALPAPGGLPDGRVDVGPASVRFAVTSRDGASALDVGRAASGPGYDRLRAVLTEVLSGATRHGGALLAPFGIRYVVAAPDDLPFDALQAFSDQVDLDVVAAGGLVIFQDPKAASLAAAIPDPAWARAAASGGWSAAAEPSKPGGTALAGATQDLHGGALAGPAMVLVSQQFAPGWRLVPAGGGPDILPREAFGWAVSFPRVRDLTGYQVRYGGQAARARLLVLLALLWLAALWVTRRPARNV